MEEQRVKLKEKKTWNGSLFAICIENLKRRITDDRILYIMRRNTNGQTEGRTLVRVDGIFSSYDNGEYIYTFPVQCTMYVA